MRLCVYRNKFTGEISFCDKDFSRESRFAHKELYEFVGFLDPVLLDEKGNEKYHSDSDTE